MRIPSLFADKDQPGGSDYRASFKALYFHLYTNSDVSRAERLFEDLANVLLLALLRCRSEEARDAVASFLDGGSSASDALVAVLAQNFPSLVSREDTFSLSDDVLRAVLDDLASVDLEGASSAVLGEAFQSLIAPRLRGDRGQFFTPQAIVRAMVEIADPKPGDKIVDPAAGTGGFLVQADAYRRLRNGEGNDWGPIIGIEKDRDLQKFGGAMVHIATKGVAQIVQANSLEVAGERQPRRPGLDPFEADLVLTNPPFGSRIPVEDSRLLRLFELGRIWAENGNGKGWKMQREVRKRQDPQALFVEVGLKLLRPGGLLGIVLPEGLFGNKKTGYVWEYIRKEGTIETMIDCPRTAFQPSTDTKTNILFVRKGHGDHRNRTTVSVAVARHCGHDRRGRVSTLAGVPVENDFQAISGGYPSDQTWWRECSTDGLYYLVPRYIYGKAGSARRRGILGNASRCVTFGELIADRSIIVRKGNEVGGDAYGTGDIPFVRTSDVRNWEVALDPTNGVSEDVYEVYRKRQNLKPQDLLVVVDGRYRIGKTAMLHEDDIRCVVQSHFRIITVTQRSQLTPYELLFILSRQEVLDEIRNLVYVQSTLGSVGQRLSELVLPIPEPDAEWTRKVDDFIECLETRAAMRARLRQFGAEELEL